MSPRESDDSELETQTEVVRAYYHTLDTGAYDRLWQLLAPDFVHERPDVTLRGRERFVTFMRDQRPVTDTSHPIDGLFHEYEGTGIAATGRLVGPDGEVITRFFDVFTLSDGTIERIQTYVLE